jgi:50S ribosomal subunit-associated GTPase HflX
VKVNPHPKCESIPVGNLFVETVGFIQFLPQPVLSKLRSTIVHLVTLEYEVTANTATTEG